MSICLSYASLALKVLHLLLCNLVGQWDANLFFIFINFFGTFSEQLIATQYDCFILLQIFDF